jgi:hypothetical protein
MMREKTTNGIAYTEEITSINGASFILFPDIHHTKDMVAQAKSEIRNSRDVVCIKVASDADRDELYRWDIFREPALRHLRWYEINADDYTLIRAERLKGTSPEVFIEHFVLPCIADTVEHNLQRFGYKIFEF